MQNYSYTHPSELKNFSMFKIFVKMFELCSIARTTA